MGMGHYSEEIQAKAYDGLLSPHPIGRLFLDAEFASLFSEPDEAGAKRMAAASLVDVGRMIMWPFLELALARAEWQDAHQSPAVPEELIARAAAVRAHRHIAAFAMFAGSMANALACAAVFLSGQSEPFTGTDYPTPIVATQKHLTEDPRLRGHLELLVQLDEWRWLVQDRHSYRNRVAHRDLPRLIDEEGATGYARLPPVWTENADGSLSRPLGAGDAGEFRVADLLDWSATVWNALVRLAHAQHDELADLCERHPHVLQLGRPGPCILVADWIAQQRGDESEPDDTPAAP